MAARRENPHEGDLVRRHLPLRHFREQLQSFLRAAVAGQPANHRVPSGGVLLRHPPEDPPGLLGGAVLGVHVQQRGSQDDAELHAHGDQEGVDSPAGAELAGAGAGSERGRQRRAARLGPGGQHLSKQPQRASRALVLRVGAQHRGPENDASLRHSVEQLPRLVDPPGRAVAPDQAVDHVDVPGQPAPAGLRVGLAGGGEGAGVGAGLEQEGEEEVESSDWSRARGVGSDEGVPDEGVGLVGLPENAQRVAEVAAGGEGGEGDQSAAREVVVDAPADEHLGVHPLELRHCTASVREERQRRTHSLIRSPFKPTDDDNDCFGLAKCQTSAYSSKGGGLPTELGLNWKLPMSMAAARSSSLPLLCGPRSAAKARRPAAARARSRGGDQELNEGDVPGSCLCGFCGKRRLLGGISSSTLATILPSPLLAAARRDEPDLDFMEERETPAAAMSSRPGWYKEFYASSMEQSMKTYEAEVARYKGQLFGRLEGEGNRILELGVGTGPNIKYYAAAAGVVVGVDPNERMERYARAMATDAGLSPAQFKFIRGVAEALPVKDNSMDVVVGTLVLCSVPDVEAALKEVRRVLKPGGLYIFIEHVAGQDGTFLSFMQRVLDPLQQFVADGCHLTRKTGNIISQAGFSDLQLHTTSLDVLSIISPHIYGVARK
ncbi:uncharacterized protein LOC144705993 [Wolffia australiana]